MNKWKFYTGTTLRVFFTALLLAFVFTESNPSNIGWSIVSGIAILEFFIYTQENPDENNNYKLF